MPTHKFQIGSEDRSTLNHHCCSLPDPELLLRELSMAKPKPNSNSNSTSNPTPKPHAKPDTLGVPWSGFIGLWSALNEDGFYSRYDGEEGH